VQEQTRCRNTGEETVCTGALMLNHGKKCKLCMLLKLHWETGKYWAVLYNGDSLLFAVRY
jgi:hypothetical protein